MIFNKLNAGRGYNLIDEEGWLNVDTELRGVKENFRLWDITKAPNTLEHDLTERFDFILLNHVLCTMNYHNVHQALINIHRSLKPNGKLQVIDMDLEKAINAYSNNRPELIPIEEGSIDYKMCMHISSYGTRYSLYTVPVMQQVLKEAGFRETKKMYHSEFDSRPNESLIVEATK